MKGAKKILVALDASENAARALEYLAQIVGDGSGFMIRLVTVFREPSRDLFPDDESWKEASGRQREESHRIVEEGASRLRELGVSGAEMDTKVLTCTGPGLAQAILQEQEAEGFGTIVVGRRGVSKAEEFLFGSVSNKIVHYAKGCTVWVVE